MTSESLDSFRGVKNSEGFKSFLPCLFAMNFESDSLQGVKNCEKSEISRFSYLLVVVSESDSLEGVENCEEFESFLSFSSGFLISRILFIMLIMGSESDSLEGVENCEELE